MKKFMYAAVTFSVIFLSCKKDAANSTGPRKAVTRSDLYRENGFISGTVESKNSAGEPFVKTFTHQLDHQMATYYITEKGYFVVDLHKSDKFGKVGDMDKQTDMTFTIGNDKMSGRGFDHLLMSVYIDSSATAITKFHIDLDRPQNLTLSNVQLNTADGTLAADFVINVSGAFTSSAHPAKITGKINTTLTNIRYRMGS